MIDSMREKLTRMKKRNAAHDENIHALNAHVDELHQQSGVRPGDMNPRPDDKICTGELQISGGGNAGNALTVAACLGLNSEHE